MLCFEDGVVDKLFIVLQARWHWYECKNLDVELVVKYRND